MSVWKWLGAACALVAGAPSWSASDAPAPVSARIDSFVQASQATGATPGVLWVYQDGVPVYEGYHGAADRRSGSEFEPHTLFDIGSLTKQFTAASVLRLVEEGELALDDPLERFFPEAPEDKAGITLHQLLTHSSGLSDENGAFEGRDSDPYVSETGFLEPLWSSPLNRAPGSGYEYTNAGYSVLAIVIERATGQDYEAALRRLVLEPAGLTQTGYRLMDWTEEQAARGYNDHYARPERADQGLFYLERWREEPVSYRLLGNGGLHSTPRDMARWIAALTSGRIIGAEMLSQIYQPLMPLDDPYAPTFTHYSYGWGVGARPSGERWISHSGSNGVFFTSIQYGPQSETLILHMTNAARGSVGRMGYDVARMMDDATHTPRPVHGGAVRLVLTYTETKQAGEVAGLPDYLELHLGEMPGPRVLNRVGLFYLAAGETPRAIALLELNVTVHPGDGNLHDSLAYAYEQTGQVERARQHYRQALSLGRDDQGCYWCSNAQAALDRLNQPASSE